MLAARIIVAIENPQVVQMKLSKIDRYKMKSGRLSVLCDRPRAVCLSYTCVISGAGGVEALYVTFRCKVAVLNFNADVGFLPDEDGSAAA